MWNQFESLKQRAAQAKDALVSSAFDEEIDNDNSPSEQQSSSADYTGSNQSHDTSSRGVNVGKDIQSDPDVHQQLMWFKMELQNVNAQLENAELEKAQISSSYENALRELQMENQVLREHQNQSDDSSQNDLNESIVSLETKCRVLEADKTDLEEQLKTLIEEKEEIEETLRSTEDDKDFLHEKEAVAVRERDELTLRLSEMEKQVAALSKERSDALEQVSKIQSQLDRALKSQKDLEEDLSVTLESNSQTLSALQSITLERDEAIARVEKMKEEIEQSSTSVSSSEEIERLQVRVSELESLLEETQNSGNDEMNAKIVALESEKQELTKAVQTESESKMSAEESVRQLETTVIELEERLKVSADKIELKYKELEQKNSDTERLLYEARKQSQDAESKAEAAQNSAQELENQLRTEQAKINELLEGKEGESTELLERIAEMGERIKALEIERTTLQQELENGKSELNENAEKLCVASARVLELENDLETNKQATAAQHEESMNTKDSEIHEKSRLVDELNEKLKSMEKEVEALKEKESVMEQENAMLTNSLTEQTEKIESESRIGLSTIESELENYRAKLKESEEIVSSLTERCSQIETELEACQRREEELIERSKSISENRAINETRLEEFSLRISELKQENSELTEVRAALVEDVEGLSLRSNENESLLQKAREELEISNERLESTVVELAEAKKELDSSRSMIESLTQKITEKQDDLKESDKVVSSLKEEIAALETKIQQQLLEGAMEESGWGESSWNDPDDESDSTSMRALPNSDANGRDASSTSIRAELDQYKQMAEQYENEKNAAVIEKERLETMLAEARENSEEAQSISKSLEKQVAELTESLVNFEATRQLVEQLEESKSMLLKEAQELRLNADKGTESIQELERVCQDLQQEKDSLSTEISRVTAEYAGFRTSMEESKVLQDQLESENETLKVQIVEHSENVLHLQAQISALESEKDLRESQQREANVEMQSANQRKIEELNEEVVELKKTVAEQNEKIEQFESLLAEARAESSSIGESSANRIFELEETLACEKQKFAEIENNLKSALEDLENQEKEKHAALEKCESLSFEIQELKASSALILEKSREANDQLKVARELIEQTQNDLEHAKSEVSAHKALVRDRELEVSRLTQQSEELQSVLREKESDSSNVQREINVENEKLRREFETLRAQFLTIVSQRDLIADEKRTLEVSIRSLEKERNSWHERYTHADKSRAELSVACEQVEHQLTDAKQHLCELERRLADLNGDQELTIASMKRLLRKTVCSPARMEQAQRAAANGLAVLRTSVIPAARHLLRQTRVW
eukprot:CAMPEP_0182443858 /NCGR_PEP_ID=MMETSP1172-20130603/2475_1 /TAXON_ID=708627 /ORGANISM="Timspurckia oligopyrenoides, Strain CCMP3278" /LENGTH=1313 /DNA_ID=CAMNT_0024639259 /DNA_START=42 /DNA_END=3980 /DNA_ORIENTATION=+